MIAAPTPAESNFTELQHRPIERAKASKGEEVVGQCDYRGRFGKVGPTRCDGAG